MCAPGGWLAGHHMYAAVEAWMRGGCRDASLGGEENAAEADGVWRGKQVAGGGVCCRLSARSWP